VDENEVFIRWMVTDALQQYYVSRKTTPRWEKAAGEAIFADMKEYFIELKAPHGKNLDDYLRWASKKV